MNISSSASPQAIMNNRGTSYSALLMVFLTIFISDDTLLFGHTSSVAMIIAKIAVNVLLLLFCAGMLRPERAMIFGAIFSCMYVLSMVANYDYGLNYGYAIFILVVAYAFTGKIKLETYAYYFVRVLFWLSVINFVYWTASRVNGGAISGLPVVANALGHPATTIFVCSSYGSGAVRAMSIFREPGIYAMYLAVALIFELVYLEKKSLRRQLIFIVSMFVTFSSAGILMLVPIGAAWLVSQGKRGKGAFIWSGLVAATCLLVVLFNEEVMERAVNRNFSEDALVANPRIISQEVPLKIWFENFFTGVGIYNFLPTWEQKTGEIYGVMLGEGVSTSTLANGLAKFGVLWLSIFFPLFALARKLGNRNLFVTSCLFAVIVGMLLTQNLPYCVFLWILVFYGARACFEVPQRILSLSANLPKQICPNYRKQ